MQNKNLYEYFNCKDKFELMSLLSSDADSVSDFKVFLDKVTSDIGNKLSPINSPIVLGSFIRGEEKLLKENKKTAIMYFTDTKMRPVWKEQFRIDDKENIIKSLKAGLLRGAYGLFLAVDSDIPKQSIERFRNMAKYIDLDVLDTVIFDNKELFSVKAQRIVSEPKNAINLEHYLEENENDFSKVSEYMEFTSFYTKEKIVGMNVVDEASELKKLLKLGYQHNSQENFGYIIYDKNNIAIKTGDLFKGGINESIVDSRILLRELLSTENSHGVLIYHNHPSGSVKPSHEDLETTLKLKAILSGFNIEYLDHLIIGKENVFSCSDKLGRAYASENVKYLNKQIGKIEFEDEWDMEI